MKLGIFPSCCLAIKYICFKVGWKVILEVVLLVTNPCLWFYMKHHLFFVLIFTNFEIVYVNDARTSSIKCDENESCGSWFTRRQKNIHFWLLSQRSRVEGKSLFYEPFLFSENDVNSLSCAQKSSVCQTTAFLIHRKRAAIDYLV